MPGQRSSPLAFLFRRFDEQASTLTAHHVLGALDAVQLASALELRDSLPAEAHPLTFLSADDDCLTLLGKSTSKLKTLKVRASQKNTFLA